MRDDRLIYRPAATASRMHGVADRCADFVTAHQLSDPARWRRLVEPFRDRSDSGNGGWRGEYWGKMMRGAVTVYEYTRDAALKEILTDSVRDLLSAEAPTGGFSSYREGDGFRDWDLWCRKYVMLGLEYYLEICDDDALQGAVLAALLRHAKAIFCVVGDRSEGKIPVTETSGIYGGMNSASILEPMLKLWQLTGDEDCRHFAEHILSTGGSRTADIFGLAYADRIPPYAYGESKAYEMMSCFEGLAEYYTLTGDPVRRDAALRFGRKVRETDVTVIGCCGTLSEFFDCSAMRQTRKNETGVMQETCVSVTWMRLCRRLFSLDGDIGWLDEIERTFYNAYLGAMNTEGCHARNERLTFLSDAVPTLLAFDSYSPLIPGVRGVETGGAQRLADGGYFGCCEAIASAGAGLLPASTLWKTEGLLLLAFYEDGEYETVTPGGQRLCLSVSGGYPAGLHVTVRLSLDSPEDFTLGFRIPGWSAVGCVRINGEVQPCRAGTVCPIRRTWRNGDRMDLSFDDRVQLTRAPVYDRKTVFRIDWSNGRMVPEEVPQEEQARHYISLRRGPLVLAADRRLGRDPEQPVRVRGQSGEYLTALPLRGEIPYPCIYACRVQFGGESVLLTDYSSAGKSWDRRSACGAWLPADFEETGYEASV